MKKVARIENMFMIRQTFQKQTKAFFIHYAMTSNFWDEKKNALFLCTNNMNKQKKRMLKYVEQHLFWSIIYPHF
jgi:hypothetical protein